MFLYHLHLSTSLYASYSFLRFYISLCLIIPFPTLTYSSQGFVIFLTFCYPPYLMLSSLSLATPPNLPISLPTLQHLRLFPIISCRLPYAYGTSPYVISLNPSIPMLDHFLLAHFSTTSLSFFIPFDPSPFLFHELVNGFI